MIVKWGEVFLFVIIGALFVTSYFIIIPAEDAVILYDYAKNLATHGVITYGDGNSLPIEGATDFLWMVAIAALAKLGLEPFLSSLIFNMIGGLAIVYFLKQLKISAWITLIAILSTPYLCSTLDGFSTLSFSSWYVFCLYLCIKKNKALYLSLFVLCLLRPDGVPWGLGILLFRFLNNKNINIREELLNALVQLIIPGIIYFIWRAWYFSEYLPLPFIVKATGSRDLFFFYKKSLEKLELVLIPILTAWLFVKNKRLFFTNAFALFIIPSFFYATMRLDQNIGNRFLAPMFFGSLAIFGTQNSLKPKLAFVFLSAVLSFSLTIETWHNALSSSTENVYYVANELAQIHGKMLVTEAGRLAYYSHWTVDDSWGLNTPHYTYHLINDSDLLDKNYDLIAAHCSLELLQGKINMPAPVTRSWGNQCKVLVSYMRNANYSIILVPFHREHSIREPISDAPHNLLQNSRACVRYDIYAISKKFSNNKRLKEILMRHGGIFYENALSISQDSVCEVKN